MMADYNYIYLLQMYDVNTSRSVYKIGKTKRLPHKRISEYDPCNKLIFILSVDNCDLREKELLKIMCVDSMLTKVGRKNEYFYCDDYMHIFNLVMSTLCKSLNIDKMCDNIKTNETNICTWVETSLNKNQNGYISITYLRDLYNEKMRKFINQKEFTNNIKMKYNVMRISRKDLGGKKMCLMGFDLPDIND